VQTTNAKDGFMYKSKMQRNSEGGWKLCCAWDVKAQVTEEGCKRFVFKTQRDCNNGQVVDWIIYHPLVRIDKQ